MTENQIRLGSEDIVSSNEVQQSPSKRKYVKWTAEHDRILINYVKENPFNRNEAFRKTSAETGHPFKSCLDRWFRVVSLQENTTAISLFTFGTKKYFPNRTSYVEGRNKTAPVSPRVRFWNRIKEIFGL
jgi:hypothetical protein